MRPVVKVSGAFMALILLGTLLLASCQGGQITIDINGGFGDGDDAGGNTSNQTLFVLMVVLLVAMFAMVLVAMSSR